jgi:hypothetical protein
MGSWLGFIGSFSLPEGETHKTEKSEKVDGFMDAGELFKMDHGIQVALDWNNANAKPLNKKITPRGDVPFKELDPDAFIPSRAFKALWGKPEFQQLFAKGELVSFQISSGRFHL